MGWNRESIRKSMEERLPVNLTAEELRARLIDLATAIYPVVSVFSGIDDTPRGTWFTSMLFPWECDEEGFTNFTHHYLGEDSNWAHANPTPSEIHSEDYEMTESVSIGSGGKEANIVDDDFIFLQSYGEFIGGQAYNGSISASDIRYLTSVYGNSIK